MRKKNTEMLQDVIRRFLDESKLDGHLNEKHIIDGWPIVLGTNIMRYTVDLKVYNRVLYVTLNSSVLRHDLFLSREQILQSLNRYAGAEVISDIVFK